MNSQVAVAEDYRSCLMLNIIGCIDPVCLILCIFAGWFQVLLMHVILQGLRKPRLVLLVLYIKLVFSFSAGEGVAFDIFMKLGKFNCGLRWLYCNLFEFYRYLAAFGTSFIVQGHTPPCRCQCWVYEYLALASTLFFNYNFLNFLTETWNESSRTIRWIISTPSQKN